MMHNVQHIWLEASLSHLLKKYASDYLKYNVIDFSDNKTNQGNFASTDPRVTYVYACQDAIVTALLQRKLWSEYPYIRKIYPLDNKVGEVLRRICRDTDLYLNKDKVQSMLNKLDLQISEVKRKVFAITGYQFQLNSNRDKADALLRHVTLTEKTKGGAWAVNDDALARIDHPLARLFQEVFCFE